MACAPPKPNAKSVLRTAWQANIAPFGLSRKHIAAATHERTALAPYKEVTLVAGLGNVREQRGVDEPAVENHQRVLGQVFDERSCPGLLGLAAAAAAKVAQWRNNVIPMTSHTTASLKSLRRRIVRVPVRASAWRTHGTAISEFNRYGCNPVTCR